MRSKLFMGAVLTILHRYFGEHVPRLQQWPRRSAHAGSVCAKRCHELRSAVHMCMRGNGKLHAQSWSKSMQQTAIAVVGNMACTKCVLQHTRLLHHVPCVPLRFMAVFESRHTTGLLPQGRACA